MPLSLRRLPRLLGSLLALLCIGFVAWRLWQLAPVIFQQSNWPTLLARMSLSTIVYSLGGMLLAVAWWQLLRAFADPGARFVPAVIGHMRAQLAKYLPGNVFHLATRHVHARRAGLEHINLASAALAESLLLVVVAVILSQMAPGARLPASLQLLAAWRWPLLVCVAVGLIVGFRFLRARSSPLSTTLSFRPWLLGLCAAVLCYLLFFVLTAIAFANLIGPVDLAPAALLSLLAISWLGGFLVVGAPGGVGVREALLIALLGPLLGDAQSLVAALAFRVVTVLADLAVFLVGMSLSRRSAGA